MNILSIALAAIGLFVLLQVIRLYLTVRSVTRIRVKNAGYELQAIDDLPAYLRDLAKVYEEELFDLGFKLSHCQLVDGPFSPEHPRWQLVYLNASQRTYAILTIPTLPDQTAPCRVEFETLFSDNQSLNTVNGLSHIIVGELPDTILLDPYATTTKDQLAVHLTALFKLEKTPIILTPAEFIAASERSSDKYISKLQSDGLIKPQNEHYALRLRAAIRYVCRFLIGNRKAKRLHRQRNESTEFVVSVPIEVEVESFQRIASQSARPKQMKWIGKTTLLLVTLLLFALSFGFSMSLRFLAMLILALLIHELGHVLGMRLFKYGDPKILFLPFLGAVTISSPENAKPHQRVIVLFLGPVPGLILGTICWIAYGCTGSEAVRDAATTLLALNFFNLLPVMPLDGGQILDLILFSRFPLAQTVFQAVGLVCLTMLSLLSGVPVLLVVSALGFFTVLSLFRKRQFLSELRKELGETGAGQALSERETLFEIFKLMRKKPLAGYHFAKKYQLAKYAVDNLAIDFPSLKTIAVSLSVYTVFLVLPVIVFAIVVFAAVSRSWLGLVLPQPFRRSWPELALQQPLGDGETLVFSHSTGYSADLYLIDDVDGLRPIMQSENLFAGELVWSPDGTRIIYTTVTREGYRHYVIDADGANRHQVPSGDHYVGWLQWSPDSSRLAGLAYDFSDDAVSDTPRFYIIAVATGETLELPVEAEDVEDFVWMSDSQSLLTIVWMDDSIAAQVYGVNGSYERLPAEATHLNDATRLTLSPDASKVAYTVPSEDNEAWTVPLYVSTLDGSSVKIVGSLSWDGEIVWSPDSTRIAFVTLDDNYNNALYVVNSDGTELRQLMLLDTGDESGEIMPPTPAWSPDGTRIAISSHISADGSAIFVVNADGSEQRQITNASGWIYDLAWQPRE
jgi:Zn-dependent protease/WD40 repeat protein